MSDDRQKNAKDQSGFGGNKSFRSASKSDFGGNRSFGRPANRPQSGKGEGSHGEQRPARGDRPAYGRPAGKPGEGRPAYGRPAGKPGEGKPAYGRPAGKPGEGRPAYGRPAGKPGEGRPAYSRPAGKPGEGRPAYGRPAGKPGEGRPAYGRPARPVAPKPVQQEGLPARRLALAVIRDVTENGAFINQSLDKHLRDCGLPQVDRRLAARLAYDTIEYQLKLDFALNQLMARPDTDIKLRNVLRLGACQILLEDRIPESAATNTSVVLCKEIGLEGLAGVCNGILRNLIRQKDELVWPDPETEPVKALSIRHSIPEWLVERLQADWGEQANELMRYHEDESRMTVRPNLLRHSDASFEALLDKKVWEHQKSVVPHAWSIQHVTDIGKDAGFVGGDYSIQSESSIMACLAVAPRHGSMVLDCCAAPGGKSCLLAEMMGGSGRVQAWELHEHRTTLVEAQTRRLKIDNVRPITRDASRHREEFVQSMDAVLLDAPCSGLGVIAGKPDVKYRVTEESVAELTALQARLLDTVCTYVKKGGTLVYSTCSVLKEENVRQVERFLADHPEFELDKLPETIPEQFRRHADVGLQLLPHRDHVEGFYICRMRRKRV